MKITHRTAKLCPVVVAILAAFAGSNVQGYTVAFNGIGGVNLDPYSGHSEGGFNIAPISGDWRKGYLFGNPVPSIFGIPPTTAKVRVTDSAAGLFTFSSVDLAGITNGTATYSVEGFRNNGSILLASGTLNNPNTFFTIPSPTPLSVLDRLDITITPNTATSFNIDNIVLNHAVPEPSTALLIGIGVISLLSHRKAKSHG